MDEESVVVARLKLLAEYINDLQELKSISLEEYQGNKLIRKAVERTLHTAIEACLDIGHRIIAEEGFRSPEDNKDVFIVLGEEEVVPRKLVSRFVFDEVVGSATSWRMSTLASITPLYTAF